MQKEAKYFDSPAMRQTLKRYLRTQMTLKNVKYRELSERLATLNVVQDEKTLRSKISKGNLGAQLFTFILIALEVESMHMGDMRKLYQQIQQES